MHVTSWSVGCLKTKICKHDAKNSGDSCDVLVIGRWQWIECSGGGGHFTSFDQSTASLQIPSWEAGNRKDRRCRCWQIDIYSFGEQPLVYFASTSRTLTAWNFGSIAKCRRIYGSRVKVVSWNETLRTIWGWFLQITPHVERCLIHTPSTIMCTCHRLYRRDGWAKLWHHTFHSPALTFKFKGCHSNRALYLRIYSFFWLQYPFWRDYTCTLIDATASTFKCSTKPPYQNWNLFEHFKCGQYTGQMKSDAKKVPAHLIRSSLATLLLHSLAACWAQIKRDMLSRIWSKNIHKIYLYHCVLNLI